MAERLGQFVKKTLQAEAAAAYDKVRSIRAQRQKREGRVAELQQTVLSKLKVELAAASEALNAALVQRAMGNPDTVDTAKAQHAACIERAAEAERELGALREGIGEQALAEAEEAARTARGQLVQSIVDEVRGALGADRQLRERIELLYAMRFSGSDPRIGYIFDDNDMGYEWSTALANSLGVNPGTEDERERLLAKHAALLPSL